MHLRLIREVVTNDGRFGVLFLDGRWVAFTLEREAKKIPAGRYGVQVYPSPKFRREVLLLKDVPGRSAIEIHVANYASELDGCIAVGEYKTEKMLMMSAPAHETLMARVKATKGALVIDVEDPVVESC